MTRSELLEKLTVIDDLTGGRCRRLVRALIEQVNGEGVLDVQAPPEIAESMKLNIRDEKMAPRRP